MRLTVGSRAVRFFRLEDQPEIANYHWLLRTGQSPFEDSRRWRLLFCLFKEETAPVRTGAVTGMPTE